MSRSDRWLWIALVAAPSAWFLNLTVGWALVPPAYHRDADLSRLYLLSFACLLVAVGAGLIGWRELRRLPPDGVRSIPRARFMAVAAIAGAVIAGLLLIATLVPTLMLWPGAEP